MIQPSTLQFLKNLKKNNQKAWFDANRTVYELAKADFTSFVQTVIDGLGKKDKTIQHLSAKDCLFRINRDVRFSKDKSPYKTNFGASINVGGKKALNTAGYYVHLEAGGTFIGGGIYAPNATELRKIRQEIDYNFTDFKKIVTAKKFAAVYGDLDRTKNNVLSRVPKGYEPDNAAAEYLKLKNYVALAPITAAELNSKEIVKKVIACLETLQPLVYFINEAVKE
ncbi:MAG: hypothetical protein RL115_748 [Bacteroidota bacterium]